MLDDHLTPRLALAIIAATIGGSLTFGYHLACLNAPVNLIKEWIGQLSPPNGPSQNGLDEFHSSQLLTSWSFREKSSLELGSNDSLALSPRCQAKRLAEAEDQSVLALCLRLDGLGRLAFNPHQIPSSTVSSVLVSIFTIGGMLGGILSGPSADRFGRKWALLYNNGIGFLANVLMFSAAYLDIGMAAYYIFALGRFIVGINAGANSGLVPIYLMEIAPIHLRGSIASANQLFVTIGVLVATFIGIFLSTEALWPFIIAFAFLPILFSLVLLPSCPESPKHNLIIDRNELAAERNLKILRPRHSDVGPELDAIRREADTLRAEPGVTFAQLLTSELRWPLCIAVVMMVAQQFSGINAVIYYSTEIFQLDAGFGEAASRWASCVVFLLYVFFTLVSTWLVDRPKFGRRPLLLVGFLGNILFMLLLFAVLTALNCVAMPGLSGSPWNYLAILFVILYIASFAAGPGSIPWFYVTEVFHSNARAKASSIVSMVNWSCNFLVGLGFSPLRKLMGTSIFLVFILLLAILLVFLFLYAPETKGKLVDEVNEEMRAGRVAFKRGEGAKIGGTGNNRVSVANLAMK